MRQNIGDPGSSKLRLRNVFPLISVSPKLPQLPMGSKKNFSPPHISQGKKTKYLRAPISYNNKQNTYNSAPPQMTTGTGKTLALVKDGKPWFSGMSFEGANWMPTGCLLDAYCGQPAAPT